MSGKLKELMQIKLPTETDYESMIDDFVAFAGGCRLNTITKIPDGQPNVDYYFDFDDFDCLLELKQARTYKREKTVEKYFNELIAADMIKLPPNTIPGSRIGITRESLSTSDWRRFYKKFRPSIIEHINKADFQLRETDNWLARRRPSRVKALFVLNSGDYNLPTDLLARIIEYKVKSEWNSGRFRNVDFVMCGAVDMYRPGENPLHSHRLVRTIEDPNLTSLARHLFERWVRYAASELDLKVRFAEAANFDVTPEFRETSMPYVGKLKIRPSP